MIDLSLYPANPVVLLVPVSLIPLLYSLRWKREILRDILLLTLLSVLIVLFYPLISYTGYALGKFILFVFLPIAFIYFIERWSVRDILINAGVRRENLVASIGYGLAAAVVTIAITVLVSSSAPELDFLWSIIMFFESFTEEFFFRGVLFLYLLQKTNRWVSYLTSILGFVLIHPQHFTSLFILSTITQAVILAVVVDSTRNITGPWIAHGLNRIIPKLLM